MFGFVICRMRQRTWSVMRTTNGMASRRKRRAEHVNISFSILYTTDACTHLISGDISPLLGNGVNLRKVLTGETQHANMRQVIQGKIFARRVVRSCWVLAGLVVVVDLHACKRLVQSRILTNRLDIRKQCPGKHLQTANTSQRTVDRVD